MKRRVFLNHTLALAAAVPFSGLALRQAAAATPWDLPTDETEISYSVQLLREFAGILRDGTGGKIDVTVSPGGTLIPAWELPTAVRTGEVELAALPLSAFATEAAVFGADGVPYLADGLDRARKFWISTRPHFLEFFNKRGLRLLFALPQPPQGLFALDPVTGPESLAGRSIGTLHPEAKRWVETMGAVAQPIDASDPLAALANPPQALFASAFQGQVMGAAQRYRYFYDLRFAMPVSVVVMNKAFFEALASKTQELLITASDATEERGWSFALASATQGPQTLQNQGVMASLPEPALDQALRLAAKDAANAWLRAAGPEGETILRAYRSA